jgi:pimeloyl-ACP methyl ester carboxylesterase
MSQRSHDTALPGWRRLFGEMPAMARLIGAQFRRPRVRGRRGRAGPVLVIPGFLGSDIATGLLRRSLEACGFAAYRWTLGLNLGARRTTFARLLKRFDRLYARHRRPLALVGWSLGGIYARELAKRRPGKVTLVVTLGTPFSRSLRLNNARKVYEAINDHRIDHPPISHRPATKPAARTIAMWSKRDGLVAPASASGRGHEVDQSVELHCRHHEFLCAPEAIEAVTAALIEWSRAERVWPRPVEPVVVRPAQARAEALTPV